ncbi:hypothetical protein ACN47E_002357 [Coniothyrium glycines]
MAPKTQPNAQKSATILAWFQRTAQAHSIRDLEKTLPQVSSITGMQVKDYLQALSDDNKIRVEKIGSGNWYWSFPSDEKKAKEATLSTAREEHAKISTIVLELQAKANDARMARTEDKDLLIETGGGRETLSAKHGHLTSEIEKLRTELIAYSEQDSVSIEKKTAATQQLVLDAEKHTDQILHMEGWLKQRLGGVGNEDTTMTILKSFYGDEFDEEEQGLREL